MRSSPLGASARTRKASVSASDAVRYQPHRAGLIGSEGPRPRLPTEASGLGGRRHLAYPWPSNRSFACAPASKLLGSTPELDQQRADLSGRVREAGQVALRPGDGGVLVTGLGVEAHQRERDVGVVGVAIGRCR